ncbi:thioredoxin-like domain-containing protein [Daldinia vernicosa]|uniref:thioredoxin-like domain-containing protein n=1 Tax=Daldinia vernicosa TaxID=114800 RepID=UPI00200803DF|nr:thioredoxin-like domain-containing protein [Daldinia vernicosa]KAI0846228.1 thioredoxin-like domain-containing protein [Daldinia vernicosa]
MSQLAIILLYVYTLFFDIAYTWEHISGPDLESILKNNEAATVVVCNKKTEHLETEWSLALPEAKVPFVSIDCTANAAICASHGVSLSTTVKLFSKGEPVSTYTGPRRASALLAWADRVQRPVISEVNAATLEDFKKADETVFIAYLSTDDEASKAAFADVADRYREEFTFGVATDDDALEVEKVTAPVVKCYKPLDGDIHDFDNPSDAAALEAFVKGASRPVIGELLPHNHQRFLDRGWSMVYVFAATEAERAGIRKDLNKIARGNYKSLTMVTVDPLEFPDLPAKLGLDPTVLPAGAVHQLSKDRIYLYPKGKGWSSSEVQGWGLDVWQGRIKPWTPPGVTTTYDDHLGGRIKATQKISMRKIPGVKVKVAGRDEL